MNKLSKILLSGAMLLSLAACGSKSDNDGDRLDTIKKQGYMTVATEGDWQPWTFHDEAGNLTGYDVELAQEVGKILGVEVQFEETMWDSILAGVKEGRYDAAFNGVDWTEDRAESYTFSNPYYYSNTVVIVRNETDDINTLEDLNGKSTANTISSTYAQLAQQYGATVTPVDDLAGTIELLTTGRIDATINAEDSFNDYMKEHPETPIKIALYSEGTSVCVPVRNDGSAQTLVEAINDALDQLRANGKLSELSMKYFGADNTVSAEDK